MENLVIKENSQMFGLVLPREMLINGFLMRYSANMGDIMTCK